MSKSASKPTPVLEMSEARSHGLLNIGQAAEASGVSAKMIRHYETIGLIPKAGRTYAGYRLYGAADVHTLRFVKRARSLGFGVKHIEVLLDLWRNHGRASREVKRIALAHAAELDARIAEMQSMKRTLEDLAAHCHGDHRPQCPILDDLSRPAKATPPPPSKRANGSPGRRRQART